MAPTGAGQPEAGLPRVVVGPATSDRTAYQAFRVSVTLSERPARICRGIAHITPSAWSAAARNGPQSLVSGINRHAAIIGGVAIARRDGYVA